MHRSARLGPELLAVASGQHGVLSSRSLNQLGVSGKGIAGLVERGALERVGRGVLRLSGSEPTFEQSLAIAVLTVGPPVAISHRSAARLWGFDELGYSGIDLTMPHSRRSRARFDATIYHSRVEAGDITARDALPVTTPMRTLADLVLEPSHTALLKRFVDYLLRTRHVTVRDLLLGVERLGSDPAHPGYAAVRRLLDLHLEGARLEGASPGSGGEAWVRRVAAAAGLPPLVAQHGVELGGRHIWIDLAIPNLQIAVEFDGYWIHAGRANFDSDRRRWDDLSAAGWRVVVITSAMSEAEVVERISRAVAERAGHRPSASRAPRSAG